MAEVGGGDVVGCEEGSGGEGGEVAGGGERGEMAVGVVENSGVEWGAEAGWAHGG